MYNWEIGDCDLPMINPLKIFPNYNDKTQFLSFHIYVEYSWNLVELNEIEYSGSSWYRLVSWRNHGGRLNKEDGLTRYGDSHVKDKTS